MNRTFLPAALAFALLGTVAFAQQPQTAPAPDNSTANPPAYHGHHDHHHANPQREARMLSRRLNLTADQTAKLEPIFVARDQKFTALMQDSSLTPDQRHEQMRSIHQSTEQQLATVLTPDQIAQMKQMRHGHRGQWHGDQQQPAAPTGV